MALLHGFAVKPSTLVAFVCTGSMNSVITVALIFIVIIIIIMAVCVCCSQLSGGQHQTLNRRIQPRRRRTDR